RKFRFTALQEKLLWGDLADTFHLIWLFDRAALPAIGRLHFDAIYLGERRMGFISPEFRALMLEIWRTKFVVMARFGEVIRSIRREVKLDRLLNGCDSPDIRIPVCLRSLTALPGRTTRWRSSWPSTPPSWTCGPSPSSAGTSRSRRAWRTPGAFCPSPGDATFPWPGARRGPSPRGSSPPSSCTARTGSRTS